MSHDRPRTCLPTVRSIPSLAARLAVVALIATAGCSGDSTQPAPAAGGIPQASFDVQLDPGASSFVLSRVPGTQPGQPAAEIELIGSNLVIHPVGETVLLDVALKNVSQIQLPNPAQVWLSDFQPAGIAVLNPDFVDPPIREAANDTLNGPTRFGFDYSSTVGPDAVLSPGETSQIRTWKFHVPGLQSFAFAAVATFGGPPGGPVIAGLVFHDLDGNGTRDPQEPPMFGWITLLRPDGVTAATGTMDGGLYSFPVQDVGLHRLTLEPPALDCLCEVVVTTPNPLQVVLLPDENGQPLSYLHADFGVRILRLDEPMPVVLTDLPPDEIRQDHYRLTDISLTDGLLNLRVGFSGCTPFHDFTMYLSGGFMESHPVQARLVLGHDDRGEDCDAAFERSLTFDLAPVREAFEQAYGQTGPLLLRFADLQGNHHDFLYSWGPPVGGNLLRNGSFEREGQPTLEGWAVENPMLTSVVRADAPDGGLWALRLQADWAPTTGVVRALVGGFNPGRALRLSAWMRAEGNTGGGSMYLTTGSWTSEAVVSDAPAWTQVELIAAPPSAAGDSLWVVLSSLHTEVVPRVGLFDNVTLHELPTPLAGR